MTRSAWLALALAIGCSSNAPQPAPIRDGVQGPYTFENLSIYVVENPAAPDGEEFLTLEDGLKSGAVVLTEKENGGEVRELWIENTSDRPLFVQGGDVVKGGQQDRVISRDFVLPARSGRQPVSSFCVEQGRWDGDARFNECTGLLPREGKLAALGSGDQQQVWATVRRHKQRTVESNNLHASSTDSINEELESEEVRKRLRKYEEALGAILDRHPHAVGIVYAVNGRISTADVYGAKKLFRSLFPKLLRSAAYEAVAEKPGKQAPPSASDVQAFLAQSSEGRTSDERSRDTATRTIENDRSVRFDCRWKETDLHIQAIVK